MATFYALTATKGNGTSEAPFEPDADWPVSISWWTGVDGLPKNLWLVEYEADEQATIRGRHIEPQDLDLVLNGGAARTIADFFGVDVSVVRGRTVGECIFWLLASKLRPERDGMFRLRTKARTWFERQAVSGGATDSDPFTYTDGNLSGNANWDLITGTDLLVSSNAVTTPSSGASGIDTLVLWSSALPTEDCTVQMDITHLEDSNNGFIGGVVRCDGTASNLVHAKWAGNHELVKLVGGTETRVGIDFAHGLTGPLTVTLDANGSTITSEDSGALSSITGTVTDGATNKNVGVWGYTRYDQFSTIDNWQVTYTGGGSVSTVNLPSLTDGDSLYAPSAAVGSVTVNLPSLTDGDSLYSHSVGTGPVLLDLPPISADPDTLYPGALAVGATGIELPALSDGGAFHTPTVSAEGVGVVLPSITTSPVSHAAEVAPGGVGASLPALLSEPTPYAPAVSPIYLVSLPHIADSAESLFSPDVLRGAVSAELPFIEASSQALAPTLGVGGLTVELPSIAPSSFVTTPVASVTSVAVNLPSLTDGDILSTPIVSTGEFVVALPHLESGGASYAPLVAPTSVTLVLPSLANSSSQYSAEVSPPSYLLTLSYVDSQAESLHAPTLLTGAATLSLPAIPSTGSTTPPALFIGEVSAALPHLSSAGVAQHPPAVGTSAALAILPVISSSTSPHHPAVSTGPLVLTLASIGSTSSVLLPNIFSDVITNPFISSVSTLFAPIRRTTATPVQIEKVPEGSNVAVVVSRPDPTVTVKARPDPTVTVKEQRQAIIIRSNVVT